MTCCILTKLLHKVEKKGSRVAKKRGVLVLGSYLVRGEGSIPFSPTTNCAVFYTHMWMDECNTSSSMQHCMQQIFFGFGRQTIR